MYAYSAPQDRGKKELELIEFKHKREGEYDAFLLFSLLGLRLKLKALLLGCKILSA